jgi:hypothetical protein
MKILIRFQDFRKDEIIKNQFRLILYSYFILTLFLSFRFGRVQSVTRYPTSEILNNQNI